MATICPVCNGWKQLVQSCPNCHQTVEDKGRIMDYYDDYSAYMPIDQMKLEDGFSDLAEHLCPHLVFCKECGYEGIEFVRE
ncbi:hypothetical protein [Niallia sp. 01092]|uniref:hypothetical protein n=1 Tax=unclassified Niallia TaxID=2837522 RepID=UPI003FD1CAB7